MPDAIRTSIEVTNLTVPDFPRERSPVLRDVDKFQRFGDDNLFPQALAQLNRQAGTHRSILKYKTIYITGRGFIVDEANTPLLEFIKRVNQKNENLRKIFRRLVSDYNGFGNCFLEIVTNRSRDFLSFFHQHMPRGRVSQDGTEILFHPDWARYSQSRALINRVAIYPNFSEDDDGFLHSVVHIKDYEAEFTFYGLPAWLANMDAAAIGYKTNKWNISRIDNQFSGSTLIEMFGNPDDKELQEGKKALKSEYTNQNKEGQNSKLILVVKQPGGEPTKITPLIQNSEGEWIKLHDQSTQDMIIAHNWFRSLSGLSEPGKLGNQQQIRTEYQIAENTTIPDVQDVILDEIKMVLENETNIETEDLAVKNKPPVNITDLLNLDKVVRKGEARKMLGLEVDPDDPQMDELIDTSNGTINISTGSNRPGVSE